MKRLIRKSSNGFTYKFKSPVIVNYGDDFTFKAYTERLSDVEESIVELIKNAVDDSMKSLGSKGLAEYLTEKSYADNIESIIVSIDGGNAITTVEANRELDKNELDDISDYIEGQFSDGWGEGFEQDILDAFTETEQEDFEDEETGEYYSEDVEHEVTITASFWDSKNWDITLM